MSLHFYSYARKGYEFIDEVSRELKTTDTDKVGRMIRCVFRALRNRLTVEEGFNLMAQLPMALKSVFVDGWKLKSEYQKLSHLADFISETIKEDDRSAWRDFSGEEEAKASILAVFKVLTRQFSTTEVEIIIRVLPGDLQKLLQTEAV